MLTTDATKLQLRYEQALAQLKRNTMPVYPGQAPVLIEGGCYAGIWLECGPHEGLVYAPVDINTALASHRLFFNTQRADGYIHYSVRENVLHDGQIQMVVPIAATAWELFQLQPDEQFLQQAYAACSRWDEWLLRYRNTRGSGLCEAFCEYDTGHDNSPRWKGLPHGCPQQDARLCAKAGALPYLAPDLSATVFGARIALAQMARALNRPAEATAWEEKAEKTRQAILTHCFDEQDVCFYDRDVNGQFVRIKGDALTRVLSEHVVDQRLFDEIYQRHIHNPEEFWAPYPLTSIALNDPTFDKALPLNSWGGASQALTALRSPRWFEHYGRYADHGELMRRWVRALVASRDFMQQMNPWTGQFSCSEGYSPAALVLLDFVARMYGVRRTAEGLEWNCGLPEGASRCSFELNAFGISARLQQEHGGATLLLNGKALLKIEGVARLNTTEDGRLLSLVGTAATASQVALEPSGNRRQTLQLNGDQVVRLN